MDNFEGYKFAELNEQEILKINETQEILKAVYDENIVLIAYTKCK